MPLPTNVFEDNFTFKFHSSDLKHWFSKPLVGRLDFEFIQLNQSKIYYKDIVSTRSYQKLLVITLAPFASISAEITDNMLPHSTNLILKLKGNGTNLEHRIDRKISAIRIEAARVKAKKEGLFFRHAQCPKCTSAIDLTQKTETQYIYCNYCDNIFDKNSFLIPNTESYQICPDCNYYGRVQTYHELNLYFLIVKFGFSLKKHFFCDTCAERMFFRTFFKNMTLVVGAIYSLFQYYKSLQRRNPYLAEIGRANLFAQDKNIPQAKTLYASLLTKNYAHPGIYYNIGLAYLSLGENGKAAIEFQKCLKLCSNYEPVIAVMSKNKNLEIVINKQGGIS